MRNRRVFDVMAAMLPFLLLAACRAPENVAQSAPPQASAPAPQLSAECAANWICAARAKEPQILAGAKSRATRKGDDLILSLSSGKTVVLHDEKTKCNAGPANCHQYALVDATPPTHFFVVQDARYEGGYFLLIDDVTGRQTQFDTQPVFSPDRSEFLMVPGGDEENVTSENFEIWRRAGDGAVREWVGNAGDIYPKPVNPDEMAIVSWQSRDRILLDIHDDTDRHWQSTLTRSGTGWTIAPPRLVP